MEASKPESKARRNPAPYEVYRHFKGNSYQILTLAKDSSDGHEVVVYQGLYEPYEVYTRKLSEFMSEVDKWKYPSAKQKYRFEKISKDRWHEQDAEEIVSAEKTGGIADQVKDRHKPEAGNADAGFGSDGKTDASGKDRSAEAAEAAIKAPQSTTPVSQTSSDDAEGEGNLDPAVLEFLEARTNEERLNVLASVKHRITDEMLNTMAICADIELNPGPVEERYRSLKNCLLTKEKFERLRLR